MRFGVMWKSWRIRSFPRDFGCAKCLPWRDLTCESSGPCVRYLINPGNTYLYPVVAPRNCVTNRETAPPSVGEKNHRGRDGGMHALLNCYRIRVPLLGGPSQLQIIRSWINLAQIEFNSERSHEVQNGGVCGRARNLVGGASNESKSIVPGVWSNWKQYSQGQKGFGQLRRTGP